MSSFINSAHSNILSNTGSVHTWDYKHLKKKKPNSFNVIIVPWHISLKFNQEVLIFFNGGLGLKSASSFRKGWAIEDIGVGMVLVG